MTYPMYAYKDKKAGFMMPMCDQNELTAIRGFSFAINGNNEMMNFSPSDYELYKIGEYNTDKGQITACTPELIVTGDSVFGAK